MKYIIDSDVLITLTQSGVKNIFCDNRPMLDLLPSLVDAATGAALPSVLHTTTLRSLPLLARGKVRDNYAVDAKRMLMLASDRISAFDVVMGDPIPGKGALLTQMALFWFERLAHICPNHLVKENPETVVDAQETKWVYGRAMLVKRLEPIPVEAVVRGYLAGSGFAEYRKTQSVCGVSLPAGLGNASRLPEPVFTPATKAQAGVHDENITYAEMETVIGSALAQQIRSLSLRLYTEAHDFAMRKGIIIADTKFEFGLDADGVLTLMDEVLTPDSSRYWPVQDYDQALVERRNPPSFDKQYLRDWLESVQVQGSPWNKKPPAPALPAKVVAATAAKYTQALQCLTQ